MSDEPVISLRDVTFSYGGEPALEDVNLSIGQREAVCIVGPNGGGKTTLVKLILGLLAPQRGEIRVFGQPPRAARLRAGYMPQHVQHDLLFPVTVMDIVLMGRLGQGGLRACLENLPSPFGRWAGGEGGSGIRDQGSDAPNLQISKSPNQSGPHPHPLRAPTEGWSGEGTVYHRIKNALGGVTGWPGRSDRDAAIDALDQMGMKDYGRRPFASLSGGQRQRVMIARALCCKPDLLLLDEPTANVDSLVEARLLELLRELNRRMTVLMVSHDLGFVSGFVEKVVCVNRRVAVHPTSEMTGEAINDIYGGEVRMVRHDEFFSHGHAHD